MIRAFLDANVLFSAAYSSQSRVREIWFLPRITLVSSVYAIEEARRNLDSESQQSALAELIERIEIVVFDDDPKADRPTFDLPESDQPILWAALDAKCTHLITGDIRHFGHLMGCDFGGIKVMLPRDFLLWILNEPELNE